MMVWAGCLTCRHDPEMKKWIGFWVDEDEFEHMTPYDIHPYTDNAPLDVGDHILMDFTLTDFGVPLEVEEEKLTDIADFMAMLEGLGMSEPVSLFALYKGVQPWQVDYDEFKSVYAGQWAGKPTRAARKRFRFVPTDGNVYYLWRKTPLSRGSNALRRAVQV